MHDQESIQSSTTPDLGYQWESDKLTADTTNESQEVSPFPAGKLCFNQFSLHAKDFFKQFHYTGQQTFLHLAIEFCFCFCSLPGHQ